MNNLENALEKTIRDSTDGRPFFCYSQSVVATNSDLIRSGLKAQIASRETEFYYSLKTNPNRAVVRILTELGWGLDVSSLRELQAATSLVGPARTQFSGCAKERAALANSMKYQIRRHHIDSVDEWNYLKKYGDMNLCLRISVEALRELAIQFGIEAETLLSDAFAVKHGLSADELNQILGQVGETPLSGLHFYLGREQYSPVRLSAVTKVLAAICQNWSSRFVPDWSLSIGPGLPVATSIFPAGPKVDPLTNSALSHVSFEIGRALVGPAGYYAAQVLAVKSWDNGRRTVIINGGLQHLGGSIRPIFSDQELKLKQEQEIVPLAFRSNGHSIDGLNHQTMAVNIFGSLCLGHDIVLAKVQVPTDLKRGDWLVFANTGAYGLSAGVPRFITQDLPREFMVEGETVKDVTHTHFQLGIWSQVI